MVVQCFAAFLLIVAAASAQGESGARLRASVCTERIVFATSVMRLRDVTALNAHHVWALGADANPIPGTVELLHWDGHTWWVEMEPTAVAEFGAFALIPPSNGSGPEVWAVGGQIHDSAHSILHWNPVDSNGRFWSYPADIDFGSQTVQLLDVAALARDNVWAVGWTGNRVETPLVEHWNGRKWSASRTPALSGDRGAFHVLAAAAPADIWILGTHSYPNRRLPPVLAHWDGTTWRNSEPFATARLFSLAAVISGDAWTVGTTGNRPFIAHWAANRWRQQPTAASTGVLDHVAATSPTNAWASGYLRGASGQPSVGYVPLLLHWDGNSWQTVHAPRLSRNPIAISSLRAANGDVWAVGSTASKSVVERFHCISRTR